MSGASWCWWYPGAEGTSLCQGCITPGHPRAGAFKRGLLGKGCGEPIAAGARVISAMKPHSCPSAPSPRCRHAPWLSPGCIQNPPSSRILRHSWGPPNPAPQTQPLALRPLQVGTSPLPLGQDGHNLRFESLRDREEAASGRSWVHVQHPRAPQSRSWDQPGLWPLVTVSPCPGCPRTGLGSLRAGAGGAKGWPTVTSRRSHAPRGGFPPLRAGAGPNQPFHGLWLPLAAKGPPCGLQRRGQQGMGTGTRTGTETAHPARGAPKRPGWCWLSPSRVLARAAPARSSF